MHRITGLHRLGQAFFALTAAGAATGGLLSASATAEALVQQQRMLTRRDVARIGACAALGAALTPTFPIIVISATCYELSKTNEEKNQK